MQTLNEIATEVYTNADVHGFHQTQNMDKYLACILNNCHAELSELWDAWRTEKFFKPCDKPIVMVRERTNEEIATGKKSNPQMTCAEEEIADVIIRMLDLARVLQIDIQQAIEQKHKYNVNRPYLHGKRN
jgi:NTP pyrophosphatase (non-canonical NTP hydrolase)